MTSDMMWATMETDLRNIMLERIRRKAMATFFAVFLALFFLIGILPAGIVGGFAASIVYLVQYRRTTREMLASFAKSRPATA